MRRPTAVALAAVGPLAVAGLRFLLPYYTAADSVDSARLVAGQSGREGAVLWLGLVATLTLVPGLLAAREGLPPGRLRDWSVGLTVVGYLCLPVLLVADHVLWVAAAVGLPETTTGRLVDGLHPGYGVAVGLFVVGHVLGTTLVGVLCLRRHVLPTVVAWALVVSQPLHFLTTVVLGLAWVDLLAWSLTALAMGWLAATVVSRPAVGPAVEARTGSGVPA